jgi:hypothetical protein
MCVIKRWCELLTFVDMAALLMDKLAPIIMFQFFQYDSRLGHVGMVMHTVVAAVLFTHLSLQPDRPWYRYVIVAHVVGWFLITAIPLVCIRTTGSFWITCSGCIHGLLWWCLYVQRNVIEKVSYVPAPTDVTAIHTE